jgi:hypothetical protein
MTDRGAGHRGKDVECSEEARSQLDFAGVQRQSAGVGDFAVIVGVSLGIACFDSPGKEKED